MRQRRDWTPTASSSTCAPGPGTATTRSSKRTVRSARSRAAPTTRELFPAHEGWRHHVLVCGSWLLTGVARARVQHRAMLVEQADGTTMSEERLAELASSSIEAAKRRHDAAVMADFMAAQNNGKAFTTEEGLNLFRLQRSQEIQNRKKELLFYQGKTTSLEDNSPLYGIPTVFCVDTQQFLCSWCNRCGCPRTFAMHRPSVLPGQVRRAPWGPGT